MAAGGIPINDLIILDDLDGYDQIVFHAAYRQGDNYLIIQVDIYLEYENQGPDHFWNFHKDEGDPISYDAGGITHLLTTNAGRPSALWANSPAECCTSGDITWTN